MISRNEGREVGSICGQQGFPVRAVPPQAPQGALQSRGSSLFALLAGKAACPARLPWLGRAASGSGSLTLQQ